MFFYTPHPPMVSKNGKLKLCIFVTEQHVLDPYIVFLVIKVRLNGG